MTATHIALINPKTVNKYYHRPERLDVRGKSLAYASG